MQGMIRKAMFKEAAVCIDLETQATTPDAVILSAAATVFDTKTVADSEAVLRLNSFHVNITEASNLALGRVQDQNTLDWWRQQSEAAKLALREPEPISLADALYRFDQWMRSYPQRIVAVYANSPSFDVAIMKHAYQQLGKPWPFQYFHERCVRTLKAVCGNDLPHYVFEPQHSALSDALTEAALIQQILNRLRLSGVAC